jgi:transcriptional regulator with XRE-family HTH domain
MRDECIERVRERILSLVDAEFQSDAAFEREMGLADKTLNNWRRGKSSSYMKILPKISERFSITVSELLDIPLTKDTTELSEDEIKLLSLYRKTRTMSPKLRSAMHETILSVINLYLKSNSEIKARKRREKKEAE